MPSIEAATPRAVTAKHPNHVWHVDLTFVPPVGFWIPWLPLALPQVGPFCSNHRSNNRALTDVSRRHSMRPKPAVEGVGSGFEAGRAEV